MRITPHVAQLGPIAKAYAVRMREWPFAGAWCALLAVWLGGFHLVLGRVPTDERWIHLPNLAFNWRCVAQGILPLWNPHIFCGLPQLASHHAASLYPPAYFFFALLPPFRAFSLMESAHFWWAGFGTWLWLRRGWRLGPVASLFGGASFMFSGFLLAHAGHSPLLWTAAWIPWILHQTRRALSARPWSLPLLAAMLAMQIGAGYMQVSLMTWMVVAAEALAVAARRPARRIPQRLLLPGAAGMLAIGLMGVQFFATREILPMTMRSSIDYAAFASHGIPAGQLPGLLFPMLYGAVHPASRITQPWFGQWDLSESTGAMPAATWVAVLMLVALAPHGLRHRPRLRRRTLCWLGITLFSFLLLFGECSPLAPLLFRLPVYNLFRIQTRWLLFFDLGLAALAAVGLDLLLQRIARLGAVPKRTLIGAAIVVALVFPLTVVWLHYTWQPIQYSGMTRDKFFEEWLVLQNRAVWVPLMAACGTIASFALLDSPRLRRRGLGALFILLALDAQFTWQHVNLQFAWPTKTATAPGNQTLAFLNEDAGPDELYRVLQITGSDVRQTPETMIQHLPALNGVDALMGDWPLLVPAYSRLLRLTNYGSTLEPLELVARHWILDMLNCRYLLVGYWWDGETFQPYSPGNPTPAFVRAVAGDDQLAARFPFRMQTTGGISILENTGALPRAWFVERVRLVESADAAVDALWNAEVFDPAREVLLETAPPSMQPAPGRVTAIHREPDKLWIDYEAPDGPGLVVISEAWYPGWWARVNGELTPILRANGVLRAVAVPPGSGQIYMRYLPDGFKRGALLSLGFFFAWTGCCVAEALLRRARRRKAR